MSESANLPIASRSDEDFDFLEFWIRNRSRIVLFGGLLLAALVVSGVFELLQERARAASNAAFATAKTAEDFHRVASQYPRTIAGANAQIMFAQRLQELGRNEEAIEAWRAFISQYPAHPLLPGGFAGLATAQEAAQKMDDALATYRKITNTYPGSYVSPAAWLGQARVLVAQGKTDEALRACETVINQFQDTSFAGIARKQSLALKK